MTATNLPRLPRDLFPAGSSVAIRLPLEAGSVAHRSATDRRETGRMFRDVPELASVIVSACAPDDDPCREVTAQWADHLGAQACTEDACFPNAVPR